MMDYIYEDEMKNLFIEGTVPDKNEAPRYIEMLRRVKSYEVLMFLAKQEKLPEKLYVKEWFLIRLKVVQIITKLDLME